MSNSAPREPLLYRGLSAAARNFHMFTPGVRVLCAVSGGADSVALLYALQQKRDELGISFLAAAHFNHNLRGEESDANEAFVLELCARLDIPLFCDRADVAVEAAARRAGIEETARSLRYAFLCETAETADCRRIATGHTADDNVETVLLHLTRGTGLLGLTGIPPVRGAIVRPLIYVSRAEVELFLQAHGLSHVEDASNEDQRFTRNKIRHSVVPVLCDINPRLPRAVGGMIERLSMDEDCLASQAEAMLAEARVGPEGISVLAADMERGHPALTSRVCRQMYAQASGQSWPLSAAHVDAMLALCQKGRLSGACYLPHGLMSYRKGSRLVVGSPPGEPLTFAAAHMMLDTELTLAALGLVCRCRSVSQAMRSGQSRFYVCPEKIVEPLMVRSRRAGDCMTLPGKPGRKTLKRLMIDGHIPRCVRAALPLVTDEQGIIGAMGLGVERSRMAAMGAPAIEISFVSAPAGDGTTPIWEDVSGDWWKE